MEQNNGVKTWQWVVTVVVIIVLIIIGIWVFGRKGTPATTEAPVSTNTETPSTVGATNRIVMPDMVYPGNVVYLNSAQFENPGWVVVKADNSGVPGKVLGETYFTSGINPGKITLSSPMIDGGTYYAVMYSDNGDQKFDPATDQPLTDANGNVIMKVFHASASASTEVKG
jgi:hypothetical protein